MRQIAMLKVESLEELIAFITDSAAIIYNVLALGVQEKIDLTYFSFGVQGVRPLCVTEH